MKKNTSNTEFTKTKVSEKLFLHEFRIFTIKRKKKNSAKRQNAKIL